MTTADLLERQAGRAGDRVGLVFGTRSRSFAELARRSARAAHVLRSLGVGKGDRVALFAGNRAEWVDVFFAASKVGAVLVPVSARLRSEELGWILGHSRPSLLVFEAEVADEVARVRENHQDALRFLSMPAVGHARDTAATPPWAVEYTEAFEAAPDTHPSADLAPLDLHSICYTSGTTGTPKGAVLTHANVVTGTHEFSVRNFGYTERDVFLNPTPLAHRAGWARLIQSVGIGATAVLMRRFDPDEALQLIERHRVTLAGLVPTMIRLIDQASSVSRFDCSSLRTIITTAEGCPASLRRRIFELFPAVELMSLFASTESGQMAVLRSADQLSRPTAAGRPLDGIDLGIVDDDGRDVPKGETGEIAVRSGEPGSAGMMLGYWDGTRVDTSVFDKGWFRTGDLGLVDADGYLHVSDRKKDMILSGGLNIYSREVEDVLRRHPDVADVAVVGIPDPTWGESVVAVVVRRPGSTVDAAALIEHCRASLASYKKPRRVEFVDELPRNAAGKVLKYKIRDELGSGADPSAPARSGDNA